MVTHTNFPHALTIAGSDPTGGAGIQADLKTFRDHGVYGLSVLTSITAQNSLGVRDSLDLPHPIIQAQLKLLFEDFKISAAKTGMLSNSKIIAAVCSFFSKRKTKLIVDPVMISKSGYPLLKREAISALQSKLLPLAFLVTPNLYEAEVLSRIKINTVVAMKEAAIKIKKLGPMVLIKGGHAFFDKGTDLLFDGKTFHLFKGNFVKEKNPHGTGCVFSASITANLSKGLDLVQAIQKAKSYTENLIRNSRSPSKLKAHELLL